MSELSTGSPVGPGPAGGHADLTAELAATLEPSEVVRRILERSLVLAHADRATLSRVTDSEIVVQATVGAGGDVTWVGRAYPLDTVRGQPAVWQALSEHRVVTGGRLEVRRAFPEFHAALSSVRHTAAVPLLGEGEPVGLLLLSRAGEPAFTEGDIPQLETLGRVAAVALRNAELHEAARTAATRREAVLAAAEDVAAQTEVGEVIRRLLHHVVQVSGGDHASLLRLDEGEVVVEATTGATPVGSSFPAVPDMLTAMAHGRPQRSSAAEYAALFPAAAGAVAGYSRFLLVPLTVARRCVGIVALGRHRDAPYTDTEVESAQQMAPLASLLIRNARLLEQAREANRSLQDYTSVAVHDMRAPLGVMRGYLSMVRAGDLGPVDPSVAEALDVVDAKSMELVRTLDDMLIAARLDRGAVTVASAPLDAGAAVARAVDRAQPRARLTGGAVTHEPAPPVPAFADAPWLDRVLDNLVNNAIAYRDGPADVRLSVRRGPGAVEVRVADRGRGIPEGEHESVFGRFTRLAVDVDGTGLGLFIARRLARLMHGDLRVERSAPGEGSVFLLTLPAQNGGTRPAPVDGADRDGARRNVTVPATPRL